VPDESGHNEVPIDVAFRHWWNTTLARDPEYHRMREQFRACFWSGAQTGGKLAAERVLQAATQETKG